MGKKAKKGRKEEQEFSDADADSFQGRFGKSIPLTAIAYDEIAVVYPVTPIGDLLRRANDEVKADAQQVPSFLDFENKSLVVKVLRTKLW